MITLAILNAILTFFDWLTSHVFSGFGNYLASIGSNLSILTVPSTIYDFISLVKYFLPMGTILVMFSITVALISIGLVLSFLHFLAHILGII